MNTRIVVFTNNPHMPSPPHGFHSQQSQLTSSRCEQAALNVQRAAEYLRTRQEALLRPVGLTYATFDVLRILQREGSAVPCLTIRAQTVSRSADVTRLLDRLERGGLISRCVSPDDRRVVLVAITGKGTQRLAKIEQPLAALRVELLSHMSADQVDQLSDLAFGVRAVPPES